MNVLPIVFSVLMLLAIMTYSQLQTFLIRRSVRQEYVCFVENQSRNHLNALQEHLYESHKTEGKSQKQWERINAVSKINLKSFLSERTNSGSLRYQEAQNGIIRRLIEILYADRPFFQEFEKKRPDIVNELWQDVVRQLRQLDLKGKGIKKEKYLSNIELDNPELNLLLAHMLKRIQTPESISSECGSKKANKVTYYPNLIDFLTVEPQEEKPYRLWLLPRPLLLAIYQDEATVDEIIQVRNQFHKELKEASKDQRPDMRKELSQQFEQKFRSRLPSDMPPGMINYEASLSDPKRLLRHK